MHEAYSHEVSSAGYWPGGEGEGVFYSYAYPEPRGYRAAPAGPADARFDEALGEFVLPYDAVRTAPTPTPCCSTSCNGPTKPQPRPPRGIAPPWSAPTSQDVAVCR